MPSSNSLQSRFHITQTRTFHNNKVNHLPHEAFFFVPRLQPRRFISMLCLPDTWARRFQRFCDPVSILEVLTPGYGTHLSYIRSHPAQKYAQGSALLQHNGSMPLASGSCLLHVNGSSWVFHTSAPCFSRLKHLDNSFAIHTSLYSELHAMNSCTLALDAFSFVRSNSSSLSTDQLAALRWCGTHNSMLSAFATTLACCHLQLLLP